jgi:tripartite-type tricarboxylate transporter receptor subunit TctC
MNPSANLARLFALCMACMTLVASQATAAEYPARPVRWVVGYPAGGTTDILARLIGHALSERLGQQFIVENKPGAGNNIATETVINSPPDGYTVLLVNPKGTSTEIVDKLNKEINAALAGAAMKAKLAELGGMLIPGSPAEFGKVVSEETDKWAKVIKTGGVTLE